MANVGRLALSRIASLGTRRSVSITSARPTQAWQQHGIPGSNLPFGINNRFKLAMYFVLFFGSGFNLPFFVVWHKAMKR